MDWKDAAVLLFELIGVGILLIGVLLGVAISKIF